MNVKIDLNSIMQVLGCTLQWLNNNQGVISVGIFVLTIAAGFVSGIFGKLRNKPKFIVDALQGPTFYCLFCNLKNKNSHRVAISLYLKISNVGSSPSDINDVHVGYHWDIIPNCVKNVILRFCWFYLVSPTVALNDFQANIGDNIKVFPSLFQINQTNLKSQNTYLKVGQSTTGTVYFE